MMATASPGSTSTPVHYTDENRGWELLAASALTITIGIILVGLRVYTRVRFASGLSKDDYAILVALGVALCGFAFNVVETHNGNGRHMIFLTPKQRMTAVKYNQLSQLQQTVGLYFGKLSICFFLLRILDRTHRIFVRLIWAMITFLTMVHILVFIIWCIQCIPLEALWDPRIRGAKCLSGHIVVSIVYFQSSVSLVTDIICALTPAYFVKQLRIAAAQKVMLISLMGLGLLTSIAGGLKIIYLPQIIASKSDYTWATINVSMCALIEENVGIILATLPALKPLAKLVYDKSITSFTGTRPSTRSFKSIESNSGLRRMKGQDTNDRIPLNDRNIRKVTEIESFSVTTESTQKMNSTVGWE